MMKFLVIRFSLCSKYPRYANVIMVRYMHILISASKLFSSFDEFVIRHLPKEENGQANALAQQASGYNVRKRKFIITKPMQMIAELQFLDEPVKPVDTTSLIAPTGQPIRKQKTLIRS